LFFSLFFEGKRSSNLNYFEKIRVLKAGEWEFGKIILSIIPLKAVYFSFFVLFCCGFFETAINIEEK
jgi:hypothetical protein